MPYSSFYFWATPNSLIMVFLMAKFCVISTSKNFFLLSHFKSRPYILSNLSCPFWKTRPPYIQQLKMVATLFKMQNTWFWRILVTSDHHLVWSSFLFLNFLHNSIVFSLLQCCSISTRSHLLFFNPQWSIANVGACYTSFNKKCQDQITTNNIRLR